MSDCDICQELTGEQALYLKTIVDAAEEAERLADGLAYLQHLAGRAMTGEPLDNPRAGLKDLHEQVEPIVDALAEQVERLGFEEVDSLCEPDPALHHLRSVVACYERMNSLYHFVSGRYAAWRERRAEAALLPSAERHEFLFGGPPPSHEVEHAEHLERQTIWARAKRRVHRQRAEQE
jgi:hypothetical protein